MTPTNEPHTERLNRGPRLLGLLQRLQSERTVLLLHFPDDSTRYNSVILQVDVRNNVMLLDELLPRGGNAKLLERKAVFITGRLGGALVRCRVALKEATTRNGATTVVIPDQATYQQRRNSYRARAPDGLEIAAAIGCDATEIGHGTLWDLSGTGVGILCEDKTLAVQPNDGRNYFIRVTLPGGGYLSAEVAIRFVAAEGKTGHLLVGAQFKNLNGPLRATVDKLVMHLQRETIRRQRENSQS